MGAGNFPAPIYSALEYSRLFSPSKILPICFNNGMLVVHFQGEGFWLQKLLIADSSDIFTSVLASALQEQFLVFTCADGQTALDLLRQEAPDILIINLMLPHTDGLTVLQQTQFHPGVILAITMHMSSYVEQAVTNLGIDYTMIAPSVDAVVTRLKDLLKQYSAPAEYSDIHARTIHHLHLLNMPTHLDGYQQLCLGLPLFVQNPQQLLTKELYPAIAHQCDCKDGRSVEHSIRKAIQAAWSKRDNATWRKYFSFNSQGHIPCPTNKEFICRLAQILATE